MKFVGRNIELNALKQIYKTDNYEGVLIYGRRRIGKSELIKESYKDESCKVVYYECLKASEETNTYLLCNIIGKVFNIPTPNFNNIMEVLDYLFKKSIDEKLIVVIDEYPYLKEMIKGCDSIFQQIIDTYVMSSHLKLILCGSYIDVMKKLINEDNPLHKRLGLNLNIKQMDYYDSSMFYPHFNNEDKVRVYSVFGGIPYYNQFIDDTKSVKENIINLVASSAARFENGPEISLSTEISKIENVNETFMAIARRKTKFNDILNSSYVSSSPTLADVLKKLIEMDLIKKESPINDETEKKSYYTISDRLSLFYYRYIYPKRSYFSVMNANDFYDEFIHDDFESTYVPKEFEEITKQYFIRKNKLSLIKPPLYKVGKYYYDDIKNKKNGEFDVVTLNKNGYDFYEVKFSENKIDDFVINEEIYQLSNSNIKYNKLGFVSKSGFDISKPNEYNLINIDELYK